LFISFFLFYYGLKIVSAKKQKGILRKIFDKNIIFTLCVVCIYYFTKTAKVRISAFAENLRLWAGGHLLCFLIRGGIVYINKLLLKNSRKDLFV